MSDEARNTDASLPMWHAEEILPSEDGTPPHPDPPPMAPSASASAGQTPGQAPPTATPPPTATATPAQAQAPAPTVQISPQTSAAPRPTAQTAAAQVPAAQVAAAHVAARSPESGLPPATQHAPPPQDQNGQSLVVVAAATAAATTLVLLAAAAVGFFFLSGSDGGELQTTDDQTAAPAIESDEAGDTPAADQADQQPVTADQDTATDQDAATDQDTAATNEDPANDDAEADGADTADDPPPSADRSATSSMSFTVGGVDELGRPLPVLPRFLVRTTKDPEQLPNYHADPERIPDFGPYTVAKGGFFFLRGTVSSENLRQELIRRMLLVTSRDSLIIEMAVDENDPWYLDQSVPLYLEDAIQFDVGRADLEIDALRAFLRIAELVALNSEITLEITGHTDNVGSEESNLALSQERVSQVEEAFVALGAPAEQLVAVARGEADPIASNETEAGRATNRRVEFAILYPEPLDALG